MSGPLHVASTANSNCRPSMLPRIKLYVMWLAGMVFLGSLVRTFYYLIKPVLV